MLSQADAVTKELDPLKVAAEDLGKEMIQHESELLKERSENARLKRM